LSSTRFFAIQVFGIQLLDTLFFCSGFFRAAPVIATSGWFGLRVVFTRVVCARFRIARFSIDRLSGPQGCGIRW